MVKTMKISYGEFNFIVGTQTKKGNWKMALARDLKEVNRWVALWKH